MYTKFLHVILLMGRTVVVAGYVFVCSFGFSREAGPGEAGGRMQGCNGCVSHH